MANDFGEDFFPNILQEAKGPIEDLFGMTQVPSGIQADFGGSVMPYTQDFGTDSIMGGIGQMYAALGPAFLSGQMGAPGAPPAPTTATVGGGPPPMLNPQSSVNYGPVDHSTREGFIRSMAPYAMAAQRATGIPAALMLAINLNEQGWAHQAPGNNYFGIKGSNPRTGANTGPVDTWEVINGQRVNIKDIFRAYDSPAESYIDFSNFFRENSRYHSALSYLERTGDPEGFIRMVHQAGYATDPAWSDKILNIYRDVMRYLPQQ